MAQIKTKNPIQLKNKCRIARIEYSKNTKWNRKREKKTDRNQMENTKNVFFNIIQMSTYSSHLLNFFTWRQVAIGTRSSEL